jgi:hypothetical protein
MQGIVDHVAVLVHTRAGTSSEELVRLDQFNLDPEIEEVYGSREAGHPPSHDQSFQDRHLRVMIGSVSAR